MPDTSPRLHLTRVELPRRRVAYLGTTLDVDWPGIAVHITLWPEAPFVRGAYIEWLSVAEPMRWRGYAVEMLRLVSREVGDLSGERVRLDDCYAPTRLRLIRATEQAEWRTERSTAMTTDTGEPMPGSTLYRAYCACCRDPIRVTRERATAAKNGDPVWCEDCDETTPIREYRPGRASPTIDDIDGDPDAWGVDDD